MPRLTVRLLGQLEVTLDGEAVSGFASDKVRALLAYLVVEADRPHRREKLAGLLWPDRPEQLARANLRRALSNLRQVIGDRDATPPYLHISRQTIQFNSASDAWIDVAAFAHLLEAQGSAQGLVDPLEEAVALYRGTFLEGFTLTDSSATEEWALFHRERYLRLLVETLCRLAESYEGRGEYERGLDHTRRWVKLAPLQEKAHRQLMRLLALSGQRAAALIQYQACRRVLAEELSTEPAAETTRLYERIRDAEIEREDRVTRHNLPPQRTPFVGRQALLSRIREWLENPACRLLTLIGPGGSGKTRLALEAALQFVPHDTNRILESVRFPDGVYFVPLAPLRSPDAIGPAIAQALGFLFSRMGDPRDQLLDYLRQKSMLLVLDSVEHLFQEYLFNCPEQDQGDGVRMVTDILTVAPDVKVLATSRAELNVQGEQLCPIGGMDLPPLLSSNGVGALRSAPGGYARARSEDLPARYTQDAAQYGAVQLFMTAARRARPSFDPTGDDLAQVVRICHLVDGMPLAILLAAAWIGMLSPAEIADEIQQSYDFLETWLRDVPKRQRSMRTVFDHSWNLLSERQQNTLARLSVFWGGFAREAARQVTGASLRDLVVLVNQSLLQRTPGGRFEMHGLLRQYAAEKLALSQADEEVRDLHCAYYATAMQKWMEDWKGPRRRAAQAEMEADIENAHAAWDWAVEQGHVERLDQAADVLASFCDLHSRYQEGEAAFRSAADMLAKAEAQSPTASVDRLRVWAKILARQGVLCWGSGRAELARQLVQRSLELLEHPALAGQDIRLERAISLLSKGWIEFYAIGRETARESYEQGLALCRELGDRYWTARLLLGLGTVLRSAGSLQEAQRLYREALAIHRVLGLQGGIVDDLVFLAVTLMVQGQYEKAERLQREAVALCQEMGDRPLLEHARRHLAVTLMSSGKYAESHSLLEECVAFRENLGHGFLLGHANTNLARAKLHLGQYNRARERGRTGLALSREMNDLWGTGIALLVLGHVALTEGAHAEAQRVLQESVDVLRESENRDSVYQALVSLAHAELGMGHVDRARGHLYEALLPALEHGHGFTLMSALPVMALLLEDEGRAERAVEVYALASRYGHVANSCWWKDVAGQHIAAVAAALPPDATVAAQERGQASDLDATVRELLVELGERTLCSPNQ